MSRTFTQHLSTLFVSSALLIGMADAQVILSEQFTGGASTTGFTIESMDSDCDWVYAPSGLTTTTFSVDGNGVLPSGGGFDGDFAFLDSDACGGSGIVVNSFLVSPTFDASVGSIIALSFSHQFQARLASFCKVEVSNGSVWTEVANYTTVSVGYPNPVAVTSIDITSASGGSTMAQVRFQFSSGWDWWWALDDIKVEAVNCFYPSDLSVSDITETGGTISWTDNGSAGYEWAVTNGELPNGSNELASGDGSSTIVTGLASGAAYFVFVRAECDGGGVSVWSDGMAFTTLISNDECISATPLTVNLNYDCQNKTPGTVTGATASGIETTCFGTADDDVWFSFTALTTTHRVSLIDITGSTTDMYHALWTGPCNALTLVPGSCSDPQTSNPVDLMVGETYYVQVYTWTATADQTSAFNICIGSDPLIGMDEHNGIQAINVFPNPVIDRLFVDVQNIQGMGSNVIDAAGRSVMTGPLQRSVDVSGLENGMYFLLVTDRDGRVVSRAPFVKE